MKPRDSQAPASCIGSRSVPRNERGSSLIEVLVSMMILLFVLLGVMQLFSLSLIVDRTANAQNEMMVKAQMVIEIIRMISATGNSGTSNILPLSISSRDLPVSSSDSGWTFWGPQGMGVVEDEARYRLSYQITDAGTSWIVTVFAQPNQDSSGATYLTSSNKGVRYAAQVPKS